MSRTRVRWLAIATATLAWLMSLNAVSGAARASVVAQPGSTSPAGAPSPAVTQSPSVSSRAPEEFPSQSIRERLERLSPSDPEAYLRLGEEIAAGSTSNAARDTARTLLVLAATLDRRRAESGASLSSPTAASACLVLASMSVNESERRRLIATALEIEPRLAPPAWLARASEPAETAEGYLAATFVGLVRTGEAVRAARVLEQPGVRETLRRYERLLVPSGTTGGLLILEQEMTRWPCPECGGKRLVRRFQSNPPQYRLCSVCNGTLAPEVTPAALAAQLRFESRMLNGVQRSWSAQAAADGASPLMDTDPDDLAAQFGIDARAVVWRAGSWIVPSASPATSLNSASGPDGAPASESTSKDPMSDETAGGTDAGLGADGPGGG